MKKFVIAICAIGTLYATYWAWPLLGLHKISRAIDARNTAELSTRLDLPSIKRSMIEQIAHAYLRVSGRDKRLTDLQVRLAIRVAAAVAEPRVDELLKPQALIDLLSEGGAGAYADVQISPPRLEAPNFKNLFRVIANTERFGRDFSIVVPVTADPPTGYRIQLRLQNWTWKLVGIGLPDAVQTKIAEEIIRKQTERRSGEVPQ
jgi:hypothetical protein